MEEIETQIETEMSQPDDFFSKTIGTELFNSQER
jgi:hypothetical protein